MSQPDRDDHQNLVANLHDHPPVADTVAPIPCEVSSQTFAALTRVLELAHLIEIRLDAQQDRAIETTRCLIELR